MFEIHIQVFTLLILTVLCLTHFASLTYWHCLFVCDNIMELGTLVLIELFIFNHVNNSSWEAWNSNFISIDGQAHQYQPRNTWLTPSDKINQTKTNIFLSVL